LQKQGRTEAYELREETEECRFLFYAGDDSMKLSNAVKGIDSDYVKKLQSDAIPDSLTNEVEMASKDGVESYKPCFAGTASLFLSCLITRSASHFLYLITSAFSITAFSISEREREIAK
jgi:hypothetical protein